MAKNSRETRFLHRRNGHTDGCTDRQTDRQMDRRTDRQTDRQTDKHPQPCSENMPFGKTFKKVASRQQAITHPANDLHLLKEREANLKVLICRVEGASVHQIIRVVKSVSKVSRYIFKMEF